MFFNGTINSERYIQVILGQFFPREEERLYGQFQQDSATAHTTWISMQALSHVFGTELSVVVFGQHLHLIIILPIFLLGLFEGESLQQ
jgi:hypothetical protein